ncbi:molybdopterin-guanine dinucleotide biosynthesis protein MobA, partial [Burkholderia thailandensis]|nr:molybdopterin-guanine dinucleotide biosynthesis protein MobA [Burkholderia thailandensis]
GAPLERGGCGQPGVSESRRSEALERHGGDSGEGGVLAGAPPARVDVADPAVLSDIDTRAGLHTPPHD